MRRSGRATSSNSSSEPYRWWARSRSPTSPVAVSRAPARSTTPPSRPRSISSVTTGSSAWRLGGGGPAGRGAAVPGRLLDSGTDAGPPAEPDGLTDRPGSAPIDARPGLVSLGFQQAAHVVGAGADVPDRSFAAGRLGQDGV